MSSKSDLLSEFETILKNSKVITQVNRMEDHFEVFFGDEKIPCDLSIKAITDKEFANFESFLKFKAGPIKNQHFAIQILSAKTLENLAKQIDDYCIVSFEKGIKNVKKGFQLDTGINSEDAETTRE